MEQRALALAAALGMSLPRMRVVRTMYAASFDAHMGDEASRMWFSATRNRAEDAEEALCETLETALRERIKTHRAQAEHHATRAADLDALLTAALATTDGGAS